MMKILLKQIISGIGVSVLSVMLVYENADQYFPGATKQSEQVNKILDSVVNQKDKPTATKATEKNGELILEKSQ
jgi:hypothetical protein